MLETLNKTDFNSKIYHRQILIKDLSNIIKAKSTITFLNKLSFSSLSTDLSYDGLKNYIKFEEIQNKDFENIYNEFKVSINKDSLNNVQKIKPKLSANWLMKLYTSGV